MEHLVFPFKLQNCHFIKCLIELCSFTYLCAVGLMAAVFFHKVKPKLHPLPVRSCGGDTAKELERLRGNLPPQGGDPEQELQAHPGHALGPANPQDPDQHSAG